MMEIFFLPVLLIRIGFNADPDPDVYFFFTFGNFSGFWIKDPHSQHGSKFKRAKSTLFLTLILSSQVESF
jgi:hypothetical protein